MTEPFTVSFAETLAAVKPAWHAVTANADVFMQGPALSALEAAPPDNVSPRYGLVWRGDEPVAAMALQLVRFAGRTGVARSAPLHGVAQFIDERALVLGSLSGWGETGLAVAAGVDPSEVWPALARVLDGLRRFERGRGVVNLTLLKDVGPLPPDDDLRRAGYERLPAGADMHLTLGARWPTFDSYLASLTSKSRNAVKRTLREVEAAGYRVRSLSVDDVRAAEARIDELYGQVWANADVRPVRLSGRFFVELKQRLGLACEIVGLERGGRLDGFAVVLRNRTSCVGYYLGFERAAEAPLYLRLLLGMIDVGIGWRCDAISLGRTSEEPKARLGATAVHRWWWAKHRTPPLNWAVGAILGNLQPPEVPRHRVFRDASRPPPTS